MSTCAMYSLTYSLGQLPCVLVVTSAGTPGRTFFQLSKKERSIRPPTKSPSASPPKTLDSFLVLGRTFAVNPSPFKRIAKTTTPLCSNIVLEGCYGICKACQPAVCSLHMVLHNKPPQPWRTRDLFLINLWDYLFKIQGPSHDERQR